MQKPQHVDAGSTGEMIPVHLHVTALVNDFHEVTAFMVRRKILVEGRIRIPQKCQADVREDDAPAIGCAELFCSDTRMSKRGSCFFASSAKNSPAGPAPTTWIFTVAPLSRRYGGLRETGGRRPSSSAPTAFAAAARRLALSTLPTRVSGKASTTSTRSGHLYLARPWRRGRRRALSHRAASFPGGRSGRRRPSRRRTGRASPPAWRLPRPGVG